MRFLQLWNPGNKEHPEYEWAEVQKNNPLNEGLKAADRGA